MIIQIQPKNLEGINEIANELLIEVYDNNIVTKNNVRVYYHLRDTFQTTPILHHVTKEEVQLPYKILKSNTLFIEGEDFNSLMLDKNYIITYITNLLQLEPINK